MPRLPVVAGQFYDDDSELLRKDLEQCFSSDLGPHSINNTEAKPLIKGIISPHAGYLYSGPCAAHAYNELSMSKKPDVFILLGTSHSGYKTCLSSEDWQTPLGLVKNDIELCSKLSEALQLPINNIAHKNEHSIEVQLPFLQFVVKKPIIVPLMVSHDIDPVDLGKRLKFFISRLKKQVTVIASSDFTHYGISYGYMPFVSNQKDNLYKLDKAAIDLILAGKTGKFLDFIEEKGATICGAMPISVLLEAIAPAKGELLKYYTSADITGDYSNAVGYASIIFR